MNKQLLIEYIPFNLSPQILKESLDTNRGKLIVRGVIQRANVKNGNGRIYPKEILEREIEKYKNTFIKEQRALGELDHSSDSVIHLKNVSHVILNIWWEGNDVMAEIEILPTPSGNILRALIESRITVGISSRAMGSVKPLGEAVEVQDDLDLICWDFVSTPSTQGAFMEVVQESLIKPLKPIKNISKINELVTEIICNNTGFCECEFKK